jgi:hypothetical protein
VVDAEDRILGKAAMQDAVELLRRGEVAAKGLLHHHARILGAAGLGEALGGHLEDARRDGQVVERTLGLAERLAQLHVGVGHVVVAAHVVQERGEPVKDGVVVAPVLFEALAGAVAQRVVAPVAAREAEDGHVEVFVAYQAVEGREDLLVREIARGAEEDDDVRARPGHQLFSSAGFS